MAAKWISHGGGGNNEISINTRKIDNYLFEKVYFPERMF